MDCAAQGLFRSSPRLYNWHSVCIPKEAHASTGQMHGVGNCSHFYGGIGPDRQLQAIGQSQWSWSQTNLGLHLESTPY